MARVFIAVGHGGSDPGAVANGLKESEINLNICIETEKQLKRHGVEVKMSRYREEDDPLEQEIAECNAYNPDLAFTQHVNAGGGDGAEFFISVRQDLTKGLDKKLAENLEKEYKALGQNSRGIKTKTLSSGQDYYGFIIGVKAPSLISEVAFIDNKADIAIVDTLDKQKKFGIANAKAILATLGIVYKSEENYKPRKGYLNVKPFMNVWSVFKSDQYWETWNRLTLLNCKEGLSFKILENPRYAVYKVESFNGVGWCYAEDNGNTTVTDKPTYKVSEEPAPEVLYDVYVNGERKLRKCLGKWIPKEIEKYLNDESDEIRIEISK